MNRLLSSDNTFVTASFGIDKSTDGLDGIPLGVSSSGEIFVKVGFTSQGTDGGIVDAAPVDNVGSGLPYGATRYTVSYDGDGNPQYINYFKSTPTDTNGYLITRELVYTGGNLTESKDYVD